MFSSSDRWMWALSTVHEILFIHYENKAGYKQVSRILGLPLTTQHAWLWTVGWNKCFLGKSSEPYEGKTQKHKTHECLTVKYQHQLLPGNKTDKMYLYKKCSYVYFSIRVVGNMLLLGHFAVEKCTIPWDTLCNINN